MAAPTKYNETSSPKQFSVSVEMAVTTATAKGRVASRSGPLPYFLSDEQRQIAATLERFLAERAPIDGRRGILSVGVGSDTHDLWQELGALGVLGAPIPAENGGLGGSTPEIGLVMEALGKYLVATPFVHSNILAASVLLAVNADLSLDSIVSGEEVLMPALWEPGHRYEPRYVSARAVVQPDGSYLVTGHKMTMFGGSGTEYLVSAREGQGGGKGSDRTEHGITLFRVPANSAGVTVSVGQNFDGSKVAEVKLDRVTVPNTQRLGPSEQAYDLIAPAVRLSILANCAEAVGAMQAMFERTLEYVKVRSQFGVALGSFQAIQHRLVDMFSAIETARANVRSGLARFGSWNDSEQARYIAMVKLYTDQTSRLVMREAVQLHGGMGMTDELMIGHYFKRLLMIRLAFSSPQQQLADSYPT